MMQLRSRSSIASVPWWRIARDLAVSKSHNLSLWFRNGLCGRMLATVDVSAHLGEDRL